ncbi:CARBOXYPEPTIDASE [Salix viminalis]|uniref:Carboxypeptidase n=1 Tax=Salix viminalis TaxID=40686 RepID=A0A9Q0V3X5_SALVM|nr:CARBOXYPEPTIDASE [Salix viminalis]
MGSQPWMIMVVICATFMQISRSVDNSSVDDKILSLPGQPPVSFQQYSGYVTIDENQHRALFYYFVEAESHPASKPLVLWLNGGPGCSSIGIGAFSENGPFRPSWWRDSEANMLYLESPAGVGFSYSTNQSFYDLVNDTITAQDSFIFLQQWFVKFPEYKDRDFYITGESYAGHYVPQLAHLIAQSGLKFNLKGIAVGNALLEFNTDFNSEGDYYWAHGLISDATYELMNSVCNSSQLWRESITGSRFDACVVVNKRLSVEFPKAFDGYNVIGDTCTSSGESQLDVPGYPFRPKFQVTPSVQAELDQTKDSENIDVCVKEKSSQYLNRKDVQEALHAQLVGVTRWTGCSSVVNYDMLNLEIPTVNIVGSLVSSGIRVLVYSGDQDSVIPFIGSRILVDGLAKELGLNATVPYRPWIEDKQVGGWTQVYGDILTFATIRGAGHLAPLTSPKRSLALFAAFLSGKSLPEALPN